MVDEHEEVMCVTGSKPPLCGKPTPRGIVLGDFLKRKKNTTEVKMSFSVLIEDDEVTIQPKQEQTKTIKEINE